MILNTDNPDKTFKLVNLLHLLSIIIQGLLILIAYYFVTKKNEYSITDQNILIYIQYVYIFIVLSIIPLSEYYLKQKLKKALKIENKSERLETYMISIIMKLAVIEFINMAAIVAYFLSGNKTFLYISVILALFFLISRPGKERILEDLNM